MKYVPSILVFGLGLLSWSTPGYTQNWPNWRGPHHNGVSTERNLPAEWSDSKNIRWRLSLPGPAPSTPIVWNDRIFLTSADDEDNLLLISITRSGDVAWIRKVDEGNIDHRQGESNKAAPSPCTDGESVWSYFGTGMLACHDFDGNEIWKFNIEDRYGKIQLGHGINSSPVLYGDLVYLLLIHKNAQLVIAFDKQSGKEVWQRERTGRAEPNEKWRCYSTPVIFNSKTDNQLITHALAYTVGHDLASGRELWRVKMDFGTDFDSPMRFIGTPAVSGDWLVVTSAKNGPVYCVDAGKPRNENANRINWIQERCSPDITSPLVQAGLVYLCWENGRLLVFDLETGEEVYRQRTYQGTFRSSPVYGDGKVYLTSKNGTVVVIKAGRRFEILAQNHFGERISASPAIANGSIYFRTYKALYAVSNQE